MEHGAKRVKWTLKENGYKTWEACARAIGHDMFQVEGVLFSCPDENRNTVVSVLYERFPGRNFIGLALRRANKTLFYHGGIIEGQHIHLLDYQMLLLDNGVDLCGIIRRDNHAARHPTFVLAFQHLNALIHTNPKWKRDTYEQVPFPIRNKFPIITLCLRSVSKHYWTIPADVRNKILSHFVADELVWMTYVEDNTPKGRVKALEYVNWLNALPPGEKDAARKWFFGDRSVKNYFFPWIEKNQKEARLDAMKLSPHTRYEPSYDSKACLVVRVLLEYSRSKTELGHLLTITGSHSSMFGLMAMVKHNNVSLTETRKYGSPAIFRYLIREYYATSNHDDRIALCKAGMILLDAQIDEWFPLMCGPILGNGRWDIRDGLVTQQQLQGWRQQWFLLFRLDTLAFMGTFVFQAQVKALWIVTKKKTTKHLVHFVRHATQRRILECIGGHLSRMYGHLYGSNERQPGMQIFP